MLKYKGGTTVKKGTYWNLGNGERAVLGSEGVLPGNSGSSYLKAPPIVMVMMGPVLGFFYVLILPFIGMAMILTILARRVGELLFGALGTTVAFGWRPVEAYLMSRRKKAKRDDRQGKEDSAAAR